MEGKSKKKIIIAIVAAVAVIVAGIITFFVINNKKKDEMLSNAETENVQFDITIEGDRIIAGGIKGEPLKGTTIKELVDKGWTTDVDINEKQKIEFTEEEKKIGKDYTLCWYNFTKNGSEIKLRVTVIDGENLCNCEASELQVADGKTVEAEIAGQKIVLGQTKVKDLLNSGWTNTASELFDLDTQKYEEDSFTPAYLAYGDSETWFIVSGNNGDVYSDCVITGAVY